MACKYGRVKSGPRKGRCRKSRASRRRKGRQCKFGRVQSGARKGLCRKRRPAPKGRRRRRKKFLGIF